MYIKKITLKNFKSFRKKVEIPFFKGFTVISGPNGSGKSNIIDSIVFCLGLSSSKALRAEKLTDLIHSGKANEAEVSITFDNSDAVLPFKGDVTVTRKIKVTDKGYYSYYYLNGKSCSLSDIQDVLSKAGIHENAYNVIMQGDVTRLAEMTPYQRRKIIDDIAGISEFDEKKEKAIEELEKVRENIEKIEAVLKEVSLRLKQLEKDRDEAIKYKELINEKNYYSRVVETHHYRILVNKKKKLEDEIKKLEIDKDRHVERIAILSEEIEKMNRELKEISSKIAEITGSTYDTITQRMMEITSEIESIKKSEELYLKEISRLEEKLTQENLTLAKIEDELKEALKDRERIEIEKESLQNIVDDISCKLEILKSKISEIDLQHKELKENLFKEKEELEKLKEERSELLRKKDRLVENVRMMEINSENLKKRILSTEKIIEEIDSKIEDFLKNINKKELQAGKIVSKRNKLDKLLFSLRDEISNIEEKIKFIEIELAKIRAEISALESGFSKGVDLILEAKERRALPGIFGTVAQLCEVDEKFALALEMAAGNTLQYIVVENEDDAVRAINYLKQIKGGRATFIPLSRIRKTFGQIELNEEVLSYPGVIDYAVNLVKCERKFKPVFNYVFRETLVVDRIETAKILMNKFKGRMVTLDGDLVERSGIMSGGYADRKRGILISRELIEKEKKLMEESTILKSKKSELLAEISKIEEERKEVQKELDNISSEIRNIKEEVDSAKIRKANELETLKTLKSEFEKIEKEKSKLLSEIIEIEKNIEEISKYIKKKEEKIAKLENKLKGSEIPVLTKKYDELKEEYSTIYKRLLNAEKRKESIDFRIKQIEERMNEKTNEIKTTENEIKELREKIEENRTKMKELEKELEILNVEEERIGKEVSDLRMKRDEMFEKCRKLEKDRDNCNYTITMIEEKIKAKKEALTNINQEIDKIDKEKIIDGEIPPMSEALSKIEEIDKNLRNFGEVNMKAIQEYEEVKVRKDRLLGKKLNLEKEREEILNRIEKYEKMKREAFFEAFNAIKENFSKIIEILTNGSGELYLDGEDPFNSGLNIKVKPYGKPVQRIESLSGGEKSLIALALIFSIQMYKPAPFYAFDEIDMFLDGANVSRVAKLIKERSKDAQFIVVSLRKPTLEMADAIVGVTMDKNNSSKVTGIKLAKETVKKAEIKAIR